MDKNKNILLARRFMTEIVYRSAVLEGINVTYPEVQTICDGYGISGITIDELNTIYNLKKAWEWMLENVYEEIGVKTLCRLNEFIVRNTLDNAGTIRTETALPIKVSLSEGRFFYPELPPEKVMIDKTITELIAEASIDSALDLFCYVCKAQLFVNGNKRTATLITNMFLIQNGLGIFSIPIDKKTEFCDLLTKFYENDANIDALKVFLRANCLTGTADT